MAMKFPMLILTIGTIWADRLHAAGTGAPLEIVPTVDLTRYAGKWYEIARLPNWFQRNCACNSTATYTLRPDGKITVVNECRTADGKVKFAKLKVSFFWPFSGDYWIIGLDPEYRWAVVGEPGRDYLWILSREPQMSDAVYQQIVERVRQQGFDTAKLAKTDWRP
jgi:apolipoprotein D and lipocalin family protein